MKTTLFERVGGFARVRLMVSEFYRKILESDRLSVYFENADMRRLIDHQTKFISAVLGGPASYTNEQIARAHARLGITSEEYDEVAELLRETLEDFGLDDADVERLMAHVAALRPFIIEGGVAART